MKKSILLLISAVIGTAYCIYLITYFFNGVSTTSGSEQLGAGIAAMLVMPHMVCTGIAMIFNWLGWFLKLRWSALAAGILYAIAIVLFPIYFMFVVLEMILCFVAYAKMKKVNVD